MDPKAGTLRVMASLLSAATLASFEWSPDPPASSRVPKAGLQESPGRVQLRISLCFDYDLPRLSRLSHRRRYFWGTQWRPGVHNLALS